MGWPEYVLLGMWLLGLGMSVAKHGEYAKPKKINAWSHALALGLVAALLWAGGLFEVAC